MKNTMALCAECRKGVKVTPGMRRAMEDVEVATGRPGEFICERCEAFQVWVPDALMRAERMKTDSSTVSSARDKFISAAKALLSSLADS